MKTDQAIGGRRTTLFGSCYIRAATVHDNSRWDSLGRLTRHREDCKRTDASSKGACSPPNCSSWIQVPLQILNCGIQVLAFSGIAELYSRHQHDSGNWHTKSRTLTMCGVGLPFSITAKANDLPIGSLPLLSPTFISLKTGAFNSTRKVW